MSYEATGLEKAKEGIKEFQERCGGNYDFAMKVILKRTGLKGHMGLADAIDAGVVHRNYGEVALSHLDRTDFELALNPAGQTVEGEGLI